MLRVALAAAQTMEIKTVTRSYKVNFFDIFLREDIVGEHDYSFMLSKRTSFYRELFFEFCITFSYYSVIVTQACTN